MPDFLEYIILGAVQGLTEFLPVSSSGHIEIFKAIFDNESIGDQGVFFTILLHFATALSTLFVFRKDVVEIIKGLFSKEWNEEKKFSIAVIISMIPAAIIGFAFIDQVERFFAGNLLLVGCMLLLTAVLLFLADKAETTKKDVSFGSSLIIGIAQAIALLPGLSRSGATIATSVLLGIDRERASRFSFLMVVPLILGKMAKDLLSGELMTKELPWINTGLGFLSAFIVGVLACKIMLHLVKNSQLRYFSIYCLVVGFAIIAYTQL